MRNNDIISVLAQRNEVGEKFISEAQGLIRSGKNVGAVLRKLQAARNALRGWVEEPEQAPPEIAAAPVAPELPVTPAINLEAWQNTVDVHALAPRTPVIEPDGR